MPPPGPPHTVDQLAEERGGVGLAVQHGADHLDPGRPLVVAGGQPQGGVELVGPLGCPGLPGLHHRSGRGRWPGQLEDRGRGRGEGAEDQGGDHPEVATAGTAQRPEQLPVVVLVAVDDATVGQDDLRPEQVVAGQAVLAAEDPEPAAEGEAGDPDRGTAAGGDGQAMGGQRVVEVAEPHAGTDGRHLARDRHRAHGRDVQDDPVGRGPAGDRVPAAPDRRPQAQRARDGEGRGDVHGGHAADNGRRPQVLEARHHRLAHRLVVGRAWQDDVAIDRPLQRTPVSGHGRTLPERADRSALEHLAAGAVQLEDRFRHLDHDLEPLLDRGGNADGHLRCGVAIARTDATSALEVAAAAPLMAHQLVDHPRGDAGVFKPGREGVAQVVGTVRVDRSKVMASAGDRALIDAAEVVPQQHRPRASGDPVAAARASEDNDLRVGVSWELSADGLDYQRSER
jgi:hypothetical protein